MPPQRILVVDDDPAMLDIVARMLPDYRVVLAHSGIEALETAVGLDDIDLLITDYLMPSMTGQEVVGRLREQRPSVRVLIVTGYGPALLTEEPEWWALEAHLDKPFTTQALREAVTNLIGPASAPQSATIIS